MTTSHSSESLRVYALLLLVVLATTVYLLLWARGRVQDSTPPPALLNPHPVAEAAGAPAQGQSLGAAPGATLSERETAAAPREALPATTNAPGTAPASTLGVAGHVVVLNGAPVDASEMSGTISAMVLDGPSATPFQVTVKDGAFELRFTDGNRGELRSADGHGTIPARPDRLKISFAEPDFRAVGPTLLALDDDAEQRGPLVPFGTKGVVVQLVRLPLTRLSVVDRQSGAPLP